MSALIDTKNISQKEIEKIARGDSATLKVMQVVESFTQLLHQIGYKNVRAYSPKSLNTLMLLSVDKKRNIANYYELLINWVSELSSSGDIQEIRDNYSEQAILKKALKHYELTVSDEFWKTFNESHITEVYSHDMRQIHRSFNFYDITAYSVMDLSVYEWFVLWERSKVIMDMMADHAGRAMYDSVALREFDVPEHIVREIFDTGNVEPFIPSVSLVKFKYLATLRDVKSKNISGLLCTSEASVVATGDDVKSFGILS